MSDVICDQVPLKHLLKTCSLNGLPQNATLNSKFLVHGAVISQGKELLNVGDFIRVTSNDVSIIFPVYWSFDSFNKIR